jgi:uncharacterized SAM-binding protein YcdF (DUF218 family)
MLVDAVKLIQSLILPPGLLIVAVAVAAVLAALGLRRSAIAVVCTVSGLVAILGIGPVADLLLRPLETRYPPLRLTDVAGLEADAIVLLGGGVVAASPAAEGRDVLSRASTQRALYAAALQKRLGFPIITTGGRVVPDLRVDAESTVQRRFLEELGVKAALIKEENESRTTWENALRVRDLYHPRRVVLVTSAIHMPRAVACFERLGVQVVPAPVDYLYAGSHAFLSWLPSGGSLSNSLDALREYLGIAGYRALYGAQANPGLTVTPSPAPN